MARRADHTREELKALAVQAGLKRIKKEGFSEFSARKVAADIGYTVGTIMNIFGSVDEFVLHINAVTLDEWYAAMEKALANRKDADPLRTLAKAYIDYSRTHYEQWVALFEHHMGGKKLPDWYRPKMGRFFTLTEQALLPALNNDLKKAKRAARVLWAGIHGICILSLSGKLDLVEADSAEVLALSLVDNYMAGVGASSV